MKNKICFFLKKQSSRVSCQVCEYKKLTPAAIGPRLDFEKPLKEGTQKVFERKK